MKTKGGPVKIRQGTLARYVKAKLGYGSKEDASIYSLVEDALAEDGRLRPITTSIKAWALENAGFIRAAVSKLEAPKARPVRLTPAPVAKPASAPRVDVATKDFLQTYEWRRVRMLAIKKYGPVCQCCGASPKTGAVMNVDHIKPRRIFPELALDVDNLQVLCNECNHGKGNWDMTDWRPANEAVSAQ